jgi:fructokinase
VDSRNVNVYEDGRTAISLAWLNDKNDAEYDFYKDYPKARLDVEWPVIEKDDIVMMGSYFVLNPALRPKVKEFLTYARSRGALIYYDFNFRSTHKDEAIKL